MRKSVLLAVLCGLLCGATLKAQAPEAQGPQRFRVIVELSDGVQAQDFRGTFVADERTTASPRLTGYHDRGVLGAIQYLERWHNFRSLLFFSRALRGFAAYLTAAQIQQLQADSMVKSIEADPVITLNDRAAPLVGTAAQILPWGIDRVDADLSSTLAGNGSGEVTGVNVFIIDTGIDATHPDLNVVNHVTFGGDPNTDCNGHGTHVAGIAAARDNTDFVVGMAPGAPLTGVKVFSQCSGFTFPSVIIQGVDWVTANAVQPAVANMSIGSAIPLPAVNQAVRNSAATGIFYAVAAGNGNPFTGEAVNACLSSPAGAGWNPFGPLNGIMTVAATDMDETEAIFSNFGVCVDIWAPGVAVPSTFLVSEGGEATFSGTSMASPHVAGAAALILSQFPTAPNWLVEAVLKNLADTPGTLSKDGATIRRLAVRDF